jgi:hypothetical protein
MDCNNTRQDCRYAGNGCECYGQYLRLKRLMRIALKVNTLESLTYAKAYSERMGRMRIEMTLDSAI